MSQTTIGPFEAGTDRDLFFICGPCVIESEKHALTMARRIQKEFEDLSLNTLPPRI